jgi:hypothetical protein
MTHTQSIFKPLIYGILATAITVLPCTGWADVTGGWDTTALTRIDVTPIKAPGLQPEHRVEINDGSYTFDADFGFSAGDIQGRWQQRKSKYTVNVNRANLESQFRKSLEENSPGIIVTVKLLKSSLTGNQLDDGIWGTEKYEYKVDSTLDGVRDVIRLVMTVQVAGHPQTQATNMISSKSMAIQSVDAKSERNPAIDAAVATVLRRLKQQNAMEQ